MLQVSRTAASCFTDRRTSLLYLPHSISHSCIYRSLDQSLLYLPFTRSANPVFSVHSISQSCIYRSLDQSLLYLPFTRSVTPVFTVHSVSHSCNYRSLDQSLLYLPFFLSVTPVFTVHSISQIYDRPICLSALQAILIYLSAHLHRHALKYFTLSDNRKSAIIFPSPSTCIPAVHN